MRQVEETTVVMASDLFNLFGVQHMARTRRGTWRCGTDYDDSRPAKSVVTTDGYTIELPTRIASSSIVMARDEEDGFELLLLLVPFTSVQVRDSIGAIGKKDFTVDQMRFLDFLGCVSIIDSQPIPKLSDEDWIAILCNVSCFEQRLARLTVENGITVSDREGNKLFTRRRDGTYAIHDRDHERTMKLATQAGFDAVFENVDYPSALGVDHILTGDFQMNFNFRCGAVFWKEDDHWKFVLTDQHEGIRIYDAPTYFRPVRYGTHKISDLEPYLHRESYINLQGKKAYFTPKITARIPQNRQWLTEELTVESGCTRVYDDFFGTVKNVSMRSAMKYYPNARRYEIWYSDFKLSVEFLNFLGKSVIRSANCNVVVERLWM